MWYIGQVPLTEIFCSLSASQTQVHVGVNHWSCWNTGCDCVNLGRGLRTCISNRLPADTSVVSDHIDHTLRSKDLKHLTCSEVSFSRKYSEFEWNADSGGSNRSSNSGSSKHKTKVLTFVHTREASLTTRSEHTRHDLTFPPAPLLPLLPHAPSPNSRPLRNCFLLLQVRLHPLELHMHGHQPCILYCLIAFIQHHWVETHPCCSMSILRSFLLLTGVPLYRWAPVCPFSCWWTFGLLLVLNVTKKAFMNNHGKK